MPESSERVFFGGGRQCGKTTKMLAWMRELSELAERDETQPIPVMVCPTPERAMQVYRSTFDAERNKTWAESWQFISASEVERSNPWQRKRIVVGIEDVDLLLQRFAGPFPVRAWSATTEHAENAQPGATGEGS